MTKFLVLLGLSVTVVLSSPLPAESQFRFVPWPGSAEVMGPVTAPGGQIVVEISSFEFSFCFSVMPGGEDCDPERRFQPEPEMPVPTPGIPAGTQLLSSDETVASVLGEESSAVIRLHKPGSTVLELRETGKKEGLLASYTLIVSPVDAGTGCDSPPLGLGNFITDCSGQCVPILRDACSNPELPPELPCVPIAERIADGTCNFGRRLDDGSRDIHLACRTFAFDGGDCAAAATNVEFPGEPFEVPDCSEPPRFFNVEQIRQALRDDTCNDESQEINLNCPVFAFDKGRCRLP